MPLGKKVNMSAMEGGKTTSLAAFSETAERSGDEIEGLGAVRLQFGRQMGESC
jgi:hypothetical protein